MIYEPVDKIIDREMEVNEVVRRYVDFEENVKEYPNDDQEEEEFKPDLDLCNCSHHQAQRQMPPYQFIR